MLIYRELSYGQKDMTGFLWYQYRNNLRFIISKALVIDYPA